MMSLSMLLGCAKKDFWYILDDLFVSVLFVRDAYAVCSIIAIIPSSIQHCCYLFSNYFSRLLLGGEEEDG